MSMNKIKKYFEIFISPLQSCFGLLIIPFVRFDKFQGESHRPAKQIPLEIFIVSKSLLGNKFRKELLHSVKESRGKLVSINAL
jgi:hypothetical protein